MDRGMEITEIELGTGRTYEWWMEEQSKMGQKEMENAGCRDTQMERGGRGNKDEQ